MDILLEQIQNKMKTYRDDIIELQKQLTSFPAIAPENGGDGEWAKADFFSNHLKQLGFEVERYDADDNRVPSRKRPNIVARLRGRNRTRTTWVIGHLDVVPPGDYSLWTGDPYTVRVDQDRVIGRGVSDNQSGVLSGLFALKCLRDLNLIPEIDAAACFVADEETGSRYGVQHMLTIKGLFRPEDRIYIPDAGNEDGSMIEVAEKAKIWIKFTVIGKQGHAGSPKSGINANRAGSHLVVKLNELYEEFNQTDSLFETPSSFEPTKREANVQSINILPGKDVFYMDSRFLPCYKSQTILESIQQKCNWIEQQYGVKVIVESSRASEALPPIPADSPAVSALIPAVRAVYAVEPKPMGIGGGTVAYFFREKNIPAIVWMKTTGGAHQPDESVDLNEIITNATVFSLVMMTP
jgi:succinyl-diaminopimelate desuccinylase